MSLPLCRHRCAANIGGGTVEILTRLSKADCEFGTGWGYGRDHVWADRGCRAEFGIYHDYSFAYDTVTPSGDDMEIRWESRGDGRKECPANIVRVDNGCRSEFSAPQANSGEHMALAIQTRVTVAPSEVRFRRFR